ncbi:hypothetical protein B484DRAFT_407275 [Ochromonadaceae sp. CCMP2298]|nr:hypothetical protein B484DRAFT_407275 [Ochromonadaceae sp. CCMP2298]
MGRAVVSATTSIIDENGSSSQQTVQALRFLKRSGRISTHDHGVLLGDVIGRLSEGGVSLVEIAFELLFTYRQKAIADGSSSASYDSSAKSDFQMYGEGLADFADQCDILVREGGEETTSTASLGPTGLAGGKSRSSYAEEEEKEEEDDDDDEEEEEDDDYSP